MLLLPIPLIVVVANTLQMRALVAQNKGVGPIPKVAQTVPSLSQNGQAKMQHQAEV
jgi:hypothetical protein